MGSAASAQSATFLVDPKATGNGSGGPTWIDAIPDLPTALALAGSGDFILIAEDTYVPPLVLPIWRVSTFTVQPGQTLIGGYLGVDGGMGASTTPNNPDGVARGTILSGDIPGDNVYTVVTITGAPGSLQVVSNLTIQDGDADRAGGVSFEVQGGAMHALGASVEVADVIFKNNHAELAGGALWFDGSGGRGIGLTRCTFWNNTCGIKGGAVWLRGASGAAHPDHDESWIVNCMFFDNTAGSAAVDLQQAGGGAIWFAEGNGTTLFVTNNQVIANSCRGHGSGYGADDGAGTANLTITNDTFYGNQTTEIDPGVSKGWVLDFPGPSHTSTVISNSIVWGNSWQVNPSGPLVISSVRSGSQTVQYSDVEVAPTPAGPPPSPFPGLGNLLANPMFTNAAGFDFRLLAGSPCIDVGWNFVIPLDYGDADENAVRSGETLPVDWTSTQLRVIDSGPVGQGLCGQGVLFCGMVDMGARESN